MIFMYMKSLSDHTVHTTTGPGFLKEYLYPPLDVVHAIPQPFNMLISIYTLRQRERERERERERDTVRIKCLLAQVHNVITLARVQVLTA